MSYFFYAHNAGAKPLQDPAPLDGHYSCVLWQPAISSLVPAGISMTPFAAWWAFHYLRLFSNRDYAMLVIFDGDQVVHRSGVFPGYFRFPFMAKDDLQIGDTWTLPECRGRGLAAFAIQKILSACWKPGRRFWYVVEQGNAASIHVVEKTGFVKIGAGTRTKRLGLRALGAYVIQQSSTSQH